MRPSRPRRAAALLTVSAVIAVIAGMALSTSHALAATTLTWLGGDDEQGLWSDANNWAPAQVPATGDSLIFNGAAHSRLTQDDIAGLSVVAVTFSDNYQLNGLDLGITGPLIFTNGAGQSVISDNLVLGADETTSSADTTDTVMLDGNIQQSGGSRTWTVQGPGKIDVLGNDVVTTTVVDTVPAGYLLLDGVASTSAVTVLGGATLGGHGTAGDVSVQGGTLSPGNSPGHFTVASVSFTSASTYLVELNGVTSGTQYDQTTSLGSVSLGNATLTLMLGFTPAPGNTFEIIDNASAGAVVGTFNGLPEGREFQSGAAKFRINYAAGNGNDVVLTALAAFTSTTTLTSSKNPSNAGDSVTFTAHVAAANSSPTPGGTVTFTDGSTSLGTVTLNGTQDAALTTAALGAGSHVITATYNGDPNFATSALSLTQVVIPPVPATGATVPWQGFGALLFGMLLVGVTGLRRRDERP